MKKSVFVFTLLLGLFFSCGKDGDPEEDTQGSPTAALLSFPENNKECTEGTVLDNDESVIPFQWNTSQNTAQYQIKIINLETNLISDATTDNTTVDITLTRGQAYEWYIISTSASGETAQSDTWRFYNEGPGIENYAPFPAIINSPQNGATNINAGTINLQWSASDVDNDINEFKVYLDTNQNPATLVGTSNQPSLSINVNSNTTYYWKVLSIDFHGNISTSIINSFRTQ
ncbi:Ig-like domain-containing protein [Spongiivirga sp. MCCC 1A20706]|uniref:Ig-like domain-containing protein n=1 Tax=Spongiivirga sp. MCCC 1A20706 TaxID=3160963 RepID=UPI00397786A7